MLPNTDHPIHLQHEKWGQEEPVGNWMTRDPLSLSPGQKLQDAAELMSEHHFDGLPVVDDQKHVIGLLTKSRLLLCYQSGISLEQPVHSVMSHPVVTIPEETSLASAYQMQVGRLPVVNGQQELAGMLTRSDILKAYSQRLFQIQQTVYSAETLQAILESAYEGIVVCDENGMIREFNEAYSRFLGRKREDVIGKHVTEEIENTRLHIVAKTGIAERGYIQRIQGQDMVVHRIPVLKDQQVIGAVGMLIFQGVTELYEILGRMQELSRKMNEQKEQAEKPGSRGKGKGSGRGKGEKAHHSFDEILGESEQMVSVKKLAERAARTPTTILLTGESGTGKEMFAKAIHAHSPYAEGPFVSINCAAIPEHLLEAELFGYEEGAFTGARKGGKSGKFELAHKGTLFLDEIGDMPLLMQSKILRVLQEREVERVGGISAHPIDVRIIAATNRPLEEMVRKGSFREDLYYRLNIIRLMIPPLRDRKEDIALLLTHHVAQFCSLFGIPPKRFTPEALDLLAEYPWPGNVRELLNTVEMLVSLVEEPEIGIRHLPERFFSKTAVKLPSATVMTMSEDAPLLSPGSIKDAAREQEKREVLEALQKTRGNKAAAARLLGIHRSSFYEKLNRLGIND